MAMGDQNDVITHFSCFSSHNLLVLHEPKSQTPMGDQNDVITHFSCFSSHNLLVLHEPKSQTKVSWVNFALPLAIYYAVISQLR